MNKTFTIISREYTTRVRKKSFLIMCIIGPLLFAGMMIVPTYMAQMEDTEMKIIAVADSSHLFYGAFPETEYLKFEYLPNADLNKYKNEFHNSRYYALLFISHVVVSSPNAVHMYSNKSPGLGVRMHIANTIEKKLESDKLKTFGITQETLNAVKTNITVRSVKLSESGDEKESNFTLAMIVGYVVGFLIYFTLFFSGTQVMRGVIEEKSNRIIEVIISSVKPFQLLMGKILGVGMVALTQFAIWIVLTIGISAIVSPMFMPDVENLNETVRIQDFMDTGSSIATQQVDTDLINRELTGMLLSLHNIDFAVIILSFIFFFLGGYFLYGSLFAAVGSAVDGDTDTQQFMLPVTLPLIFAIFVMINTVQNPESALTYWCSIIPFTSPIVMMARIPFGVPYSQIFLSAMLLIITFIIFTWLASKVYRTGILMYGKKPSWKEMYKWIKYKN